MMDTCFNCGEFRPDKAIEPGGPYAVCPVCSYKHLFRQLPLFAICGPSGAGKSAIGQMLLANVPGAIVLEGDLLWNEAYNTPGDNYRSFYETWLRLAKNISQSGKPVVLLSAGALPANLEPCVQRRYFTQIHYCALVCDDAVIAARLRQRPEWRNTTAPSFMERNRAFNNWLKANGQKSSPEIMLMDTSTEAPQSTKEKVLRWIGSRLEPT